MHKSTTEIVYEFVEAFKEREGIIPSIREIATGCYLSRTTVQHHLMRLDAWGWLIVLPGKARGIVILGRKEKRPRPPEPALEAPETEEG